LCCETGNETKENKQGRRKKKGASRERRELQCRSSLDSEMAVVGLDVSVVEVAVVVDVEEMVVVRGLERDDALAVLDNVPVGLVVGVSGVDVAVRSHLEEEAGMRRALEPRSELSGQTADDETHVLAAPDAVCVELSAVAVDADVVVVHVVPQVDDPVVRHPVAQTLIVQVHDGRRHVVDGWRCVVDGRGRGKGRHVNTASVVGRWVVGVDDNDVGRRMGVMVVMWVGDDDRGLVVMVAVVVRVSDDHGGVVGRVAVVMVVMRVHVVSLWCCFLLLLAAAVVLLCRFGCVCGRFIGRG